MFKPKMLVLGLQKKALLSRVRIVGYGPASQGVSHLAVALEGPPERKLGFRGRNNERG